MRTRFATLCLALTLTLPFVGGCSVLNDATAAHDPAKQAAISHRQAVVDARALYASTERFVTSLHRNGTISTERGRALVTELQTVVRPTIEAAQAATLSTDFDTAILKATEALANVLTKAKAPPTITPARPSLFQLPPSAPPVQRPEPVQASAIALGVGTALVELLKLYNRKKAEAAAAGEGDDARIKELDAQIASLTAEDDAADAEARTEFGLPDAPKA
jgi:NADPH:quinone reductase-like Zn-dependent oxidoreductase